jgi:hypothetical protein
MKKFVALLALIFLLTACPGENLGIGSWRNISVDHRRICFSVDKADVLSRYVLSSTQGGDYKELATAEFAHLSYPDTCINVQLKPGYTYQASYTMNNSNYRYSFFIDNDWNIIRLAKGSE